MSPLAGVFLFSPVRKEPECIISGSDSDVALEAKRFRSVFYAIVTAAYPFSKEGDRKLDGIHGILITL